MPFAYVYAEDQDAADVTDGMLVSFMVRIFDADGADVAFSKGFPVPGLHGVAIIIRVREQLMIADWEQHVKTFSLKGYNASVPCSVCRNVLGHCDFFKDPYLVHVFSSEYHRFDMHTPETFLELADRVKHSAENDPAQVLEATQQASGIVYNPEGLIWDLEVRSKLQSPWAQYPDWMHTLCASGGLAQFELNGLVLKLVERGFSTEDIDEWIGTVKRPKGMTPIWRKFFQTRVDAPGKKLKAFASEVLSAVTFLGFFVDVVVRTSIEVDDELFQYLACFDLLRVMLAILQNGNLDDLGTLRTATQSHHELYMELYHRIPKLHNMAHVVDFWEHWRYLLSCFGAERHHRFFKRVMRFSYNSGNMTAVAYDVRAWMKSLDTEELYMPIHLMGKQKVLQVHVQLLGGASVTFIAGAKRLNTEKGILGKGDLIQYINGDGVHVVGSARGFGRTNSAKPLDYAVFIRPCVRVGSTIWRLKPNEFRIVFAHHIVGSVPFVSMDNGDMAPLLHSTR